MDNVVLIPLPLSQFFLQIEETVIKCLAAKKAVEDQQLNTEQICDLLNVSDVTLLKWRKAGKIPFIQIDRKILYNKAEVLKALSK